MALQGLSSLDEETAARIAFEDAPTSRDLVGPDDLEDDEADEPTASAAPTTRPASSPPQAWALAAAAPTAFLRPHVPDQTDELDALD